MPTYEYRCRACGHEFERFQKISDRPLRTCPECGKRQVERLISAGGGIVFKGPGFYATDYRERRPSAKGESGEPAAEEKKGSSGKKEGGGGKETGSGGAGGSEDSGTSGNA